MTADRPVTIAPNNITGPRPQQNLGPLASIEDADLLRRFESQQISENEWTHAEHCRVAYLYLRKCDWPTAVDRMRCNIIKLNNAQGVPNSESRGYHETVTIAWLRLIAAAIERRKPWTNSLEFLTSNPHLLQKHTLLNHYSMELLRNPDARQNFIPPDLQPLP